MTEPKFMTPAHRRAYLTHLNRCKAIRKYLPKLELKECEVMIALYIDRLSVTDTAAKLRVDASTVRRRRDSACDKIRKAMEEK